jgi:hypothetical protein
MHRILLSLLLISQISALSSVAIVHGESNAAYNADLMKKLSPYFNVTLVDAKLFTPTYDLLSSFPAILTYCDGGYNDPITLGGILKKYVDNGGGLVVAMYAFYYGSPNTLQGGFYPDYYLINPDPSTLRSGPVSMVVNDPNHPIMAGVRTFNGGTDSGRTQGKAKIGFEPVASWQDADNTPLVVAGVVNGSNRVDLNVFPISAPVFYGGWPNTTDGARIIANALNWVLPTWENNCQGCTSHGRMWCLDTNACGPYNPGSCPDRVTNPVFCPVQCSSFNSCGSCTGASVNGTCEWCLDSSSCVTSDNSCQNVIHNSQFCKNPMILNN